MQTLNRHEYEAKLAHEKKENERRKNILVVMLKYLIGIGYADTAFTLQEEAKIELDKFDIADNIDLYMIFADFEEYFELRFSKKPKFIKQAMEGNNVRLPNIKGRQDSKVGYGNVDNKKPSQGKAQTNQTIKKVEKQEKQEAEELKLEVVGTAFNNKPKVEPKESSKDKKYTFDDQKESMLLKPLPDNLFGNSELRELALLVKR
jgi:katanin p60 ATPase-containing subunit A1